LLKPSFKELVSKDEFDFGHVIDNEAFGGFLFRSVNGMSIAR
jgi:hypothetical protein